MGLQGGGVQRRIGTAPAGASPLMRGLRPLEGSSAMASSKACRGLPVDEGIETVADAASHSTTYSPAGASPLMRGLRRSPRAVQPLEGIPCRGLPVDEGIETPSVTSANNSNNLQGPPR